MRSQLQVGVGSRFEGQLVSAVTTSQRPTRRAAANILTKREKQLERDARSTAERQPYHLASCVLAAWFDVDSGTIERYITRFRRPIPSNIRAALDL